MRLKDAQGSGLNEKRGGGRLEYEQGKENYRNLLSKDGGSGSPGHTFSSSEKARKKGHQSGGNPFINEGTLGRKLTFMLMEEGRGERSHH